MHSKRPKPHCRTRNKRSQIQKELDRRDIARLYLDAKTIRDIADWIGRNRPYTLSRQQVWADLKTVRELWKEQAIRAVDQWMAEQLARVDAIESKAWVQWERSCEDRVRTNQEKVGKAGETKVSVTREGQCGDPRYLTVALNCVDRRAKLLGLDAPTRLKYRGEIADSTPAGEEIDMEHVDKILAAHYAELAKAKRDVSAN